MLEKENQLWNAFEQMAEDRYYGYIPPIIRDDESILAENLKNLINELADWRKNTVLAITHCRHFDRISLIGMGRYDEPITVRMNQKGIDASLMISNTDITAWVNIGKKMMMNQTIRFDSGELRRFCEEAHIQPRLRYIIWECMHRLVTKMDDLNRLLDEQIDENRSEALQQGAKA